MRNSKTKAGASEIKPSRRVRVYRVTKQAVLHPIATPKSVCTRWANKNKNRAKSLMWLVVLIGAGIFIQVMLAVGNNYFSSLNPPSGFFLELIHKLVRDGLPSFFCIAVAAALLVDFWIERELQLSDKYKTAVRFVVGPSVVIMASACSYLLVAQTSHLLAGAIMEAVIFVFTIIYAYYAKLTLFEGIDAHYAAATEELTREVSTLRGQKESLVKEIANLRLRFQAGEDVDVGTQASRKTKKKKSIYG